MEYPEGTTSQKLMRAFMQFRKAEWHGRPVMGYKPSEVRVLFCMKHGPRRTGANLKVSDIGKLLHISMPTVTQLINGLEESGVVERYEDPEDRRAVRLKLTDKGEEVTQKAMDGMNASFAGLIEHLGEERSNMLAELLNEVSFYFHGKKESDTKEGEQV
ncbi:MarR family winged helix-turn-helix transcriptional regulator [Paenibacillus sp. KN14-4R]|uniref:MarR family winged helix-turn-helix transcriptional regulator n=1 Tax=Paenibacillus sp. KN14-4R TaxID=3445773 RepID=UPI003F9F0027